MERFVLEALRNSDWNIEAARQFLVANHEGVPGPEYFEEVRRREAIQEAQQLARQFPVADLPNREVEIRVAMGPLEQGLSFEDYAKVVQEFQARDRARQPNTFTGLKRREP